ncbi:hypothetical protein PRIPAC_95633 [Pristionchus pacificus]|uniref:AcidPPc domain-containing protein n=1 Tax=Pristionchus pacificus TaxID=54126 RepID=A0A2A6BIR4_PRIPA|nr:hypothetical protein PRIPAC_95633 [Pristionchus pacificus]|eukprot:PDM65825.1 hypothetical protein PRIPAC_45226 [Pristionchus pacificus]
MTSQKIFRLNPLAILCNFATLYGVAFLTVLIPEAFGVRQRGFYCDDASIQHPFYDHTIPMGKMTLAILALFFVIPLLIELLVERSESSSVSYRWWKFSVPTFLVQALVIFGYAHIGLVLQVALTQWAKYGFGRLRPHFMDVCKPTGYVCAEPSQYITNYTCSGTDSHQVYETRLSFFSGHSSTAIYAAVFLAIYLESRLTPRNLLAGARRPVQISLILAALIVCATRVTDNFHHPSDVVVGIASGLAVAVATASNLAGLCSYSLRPVREPEGRRIYAKFITPNFRRILITAVTKLKNNVQLAQTIAGNTDSEEDRKHRLES